MPEKSPQATPIGRVKIGDHYYTYEYVILYSKDSRIIAHSNSSLSTELVGGHLPRITKHPDFFIFDEVVVSRKAVEIIHYYLVQTDKTFDGAVRNESSGH